MNTTSLPRRLASAVLLIALALVAGCASLPGDVQRPVSTARSDVGDTFLARTAAAATPDDKRHLSGFRLLPDGDHALNARIALARRAQKTLDLQYYLVGRDEVGLAFLRELRDAAARGVRVRLLVDDLYTAGIDDLLLGLAAHANVEVRVYNPLPVRSGALRTRVLLSMHAFERINHRMHNKLYIADNAFAVTGGRNIGNEYFLRGESAFIDMDVLSSGPVVRELSDLYDRFWNSEHVYPVQSLAGAGAAPEAARQRFDAAVQALGQEIAVSAHDRFGRAAVDAQLESGRLDQHYAAAQVFADAPSKAADAPGPTLDGTAMGSTLHVMGAAHSEVMVATPYFVPGPRGMALMQAAADHNVRLAVMTNSLAATDEPLVHHGYARYRAAMLKMGVALYELSPALGRKTEALGEFRSASSLGRLHAKLAVIDRRWLIVGSMNLDGRSARANTELGLVIDSPALADEVAQVLQGDRSSSTYQLRLAADGQRIEWVASEAEREVVHTAEPDAGWGLCFRLGLLSLFVDEKLL